MKQPEEYGAKEGVFAVSDDLRERLRAASDDAHRLYMYGDYAAALSWMHSMVRY